MNTKGEVGFLSYSPALKTSGLNNKLNIGAFDGQLYVILK